MIPRPLQVCAAGVALALAFCGLSAWLAMPIWESAFRSDGSPVSWLSSALLLANAAMAARLGLDRSLPRGLSAWLAASILLLALDEQFMFHERWKFGCASVLDLCRHAAWVREAPIPAVGAAGVATAVWLHRCLPDRTTRACLWAAIVMGLWAIAVDQLPMPESIAVFEEMFEVLSESLFLGVLLSATPATSPHPESATGPLYP